jgi:hypothetical protein
MTPHFNVKKSEISKQAQDLSDRTVSEIESNQDIVKRLTKERDSLLK